MNEKSLDELVSMNWHAELNETEDGVVITIPALDDFAVHATTAEDAWTDYLDALRSHLSGYRSVQKIIPVPFKMEQAAGENEEPVEKDASHSAFGIDFRTGVRYETAGS